MESCSEGEPITKCSAVEGITPNAGSCLVKSLLLLLMVPLYTSGCVTLAWCVRVGTSSEEDIPCNVLEILPRVVVHIPIHVYVYA